MALAVRQDSQLVIIAPGSRFTAASDAGEAPEVVRRALSEGARRVLFDLSLVDFIDSFAVGQLVACFIATQGHQGRMVVCGVGHRAGLVLRMARIHLALDVLRGGPETVDWS
jgi:anti-anti-sigma factor